MIELRLLGSVGLYMSDGAEVRAVLTQPKRFALLAYLATATPGHFHRRDALLALFWPDFTERQARLSLRQALHHLRHALGASVIANRGDSELGLSPDALWCDTVAFRRALHGGELATALDLYRGDLLEAFSVHGISLELERWLEEERLTLRVLASGAASSLAERAASDGELALAIQWAQRALALSRGDESALRRLVVLLDRYGDRAAALRTGELFTRRLREELDADPSPETTALLRSIRARVVARSSILASVPSPGGPGAGEASSAPSSGALSPPSLARAPTSSRSGGAAGVANPLHSWSRSGRRIAAGTGSIVLTVAIAVAAVHDHAVRRMSPTIAVGWIEQWGGEDEQVMASVIPSLLETDLALVPCRRTVSGARLHAETAGDVRSQWAARNAMTGAARRAGATELLEGSLYHTNVQTLRLDLRRVSLKTGVVLGAYTVQGGTPFELSNRAVALIASDVTLTAPAECSGRKERAESR
jgi:DNA-binding SARP family transcriptional activator